MAYSSIKDVNICDFSRMLKILKSDKTKKDIEKAEKVIDFLKTSLGFIKVPDAFLIGDIVIAIVNYNNCEDAFDKFKKLV